MQIMKNKGEDIIPIPWSLKEQRTIMNNSMPGLENLHEMDPDTISKMQNKKQLQVPGPDGFTGEQIFKENYTNSLQFVPENGSWWNSS